MTPEEFEIYQDVSKGINTATTGILRFLVVHLAMRTPTEGLQALNDHFNAMRHDNTAVSGLGEEGSEAYSQIYDFVESALIEVIEKRTGQR